MTQLSSEPGANREQDTNELLPCPFCGDTMMWDDDAAGDPVFTHEQTDILGATCFMRHMLFVQERAEAWNTRV